MTTGKTEIKSKWLSIKRICVVKRKWKPKFYTQMESQDLIPDSETELKQTAQ